MILDERHIPPTSYHIASSHGIPSTVFTLPIIRSQSATGGESNVFTLRTQRRQIGGMKRGRGSVEYAFRGKGNEMFGFDGRRKRIVFVGVVGATGGVG